MPHQSLCAKHNQSTEMRMSGSARGPVTRALARPVRARDIGGSWLKVSQARQASASCMFQNSRSGTASAAMSTDHCGHVSPAHATTRAFQVIKLSSHVATHRQHTKMALVDISRCRPTKGGSEDVHEKATQHTDGKDPL